MENKEIIERLSLEQKISLISGKDSWWFHGVKNEGLNEIHLTDGPYGIREEIKDTSVFKKGKTSICYPASSLTGCSFDKNLLFELGNSLGIEARNKGIHILLGPGINIKRSPLCGRNFEYISEDPLLSGKLASAFIKGLDNQNVGCSLKHFAFNNQETLRLKSNSVVDSRAFFEIYTKGFEIAVKESNVATIMSSYNLVNGKYASENEFLLTDVLRKRWNYKGIVISDWGAVNDLTSSIRAGLNVEMPFSSKSNLKKFKKQASKNKELENILDKRVDQVISTIKKYQKNSTVPFDYEKYHQKAVEIASESMILLKNDNFLPLNKDENIAYIGDFAINPRYRGGGSSAVTPYKVTNSINDLKNKGINVKFARGFDQNIDETNNNLLMEAIQIAKNSEKVVLFLGLSESHECEGIDRTSIDLPLNQITLFNEIFKVNKNICVVLQNGSVISMPFKNESKAILEAYLGGEGTSESINDILFGKVNPSGRLSETFISSLDQCPNIDFAPTRESNSLYKDSIFVGYRYYVSKNEETLFDFGYGLSYSNFKYSNFSFDNSNFNKESNYQLKLSFDVTNDSEIDGKEVIQIYISKPNHEIYNPKRELIEFDKALIKAHETKHFEILVNGEAFKIYDENEENFIILNGNYVISINKNAKDVIFERNFSISGEKYNLFKPNQLLDKYNKLEIKDISNVDYLNDFNLVSSLFFDGPKYTMNSNLGELGYTFAGKIVNKFINKMVENSKDENLKYFIYDTPLRSLCIFTGGVLNENIFKHLIYSANKKFILTNLVIFAIKILKVKNRITF